MSYANAVRRSELAPETKKICRLRQIKLFTNWRDDITAIWKFHSYNNSKKIGRQKLLKNQTF